MDIEKMESIELDIQVAELMGWKFLEYGKTSISVGDETYYKIRPDGYCLVGHPFKLRDMADGIAYDRRYVIWQPSTDIAAAMRVVEKMQKPNWAWHIESVYVNKKLMWFVTFWGDENGELITNDGAEEETLPRAICKAAVMAAEAE